MFERFTAPARTVVTAAQEEARALGHPTIGTEHLLLAVLREPGQPGAAALVRLGVTAKACEEAVRGLALGPGEQLGPQDAEALSALGIDLEEVRRRTDAAFGPGALDAPPPRPRRRRFLRGHLPFAPRAKQALERTLREAVRLGDRQLGVPHLVLALLGCEDRTTRDLLARLGLDPARAREAVLAEGRRAA
ncbi:Clp protease N-terminal domain-containing protein [Streptomyces sp. NPDC005438]|uniref:Clp protease N-terminal domain-containing protein n=1 Tax=Streptomyces sp. NPDC005438 TaxID=3156880 RepID=UPI0033B56BFB